MTINLCLCGCGREIGKRSKYAPGHDAKHVSQLLEMLKSIAAMSTDHAGETVEANFADAFGQLPSVALRVKLGAAFDNDNEGWYNTTGDNGVLVPFSQNPSLGGGSSTAATLAAYAALGWDPMVGVIAQTTNEAKAREPKVKAANEPKLSTRGQAYTATEVKVGRWTYPAKAYDDGTVVRNTKRDGSGEWVAV